MNHRIVLRKFNGHWFVAVGTKGYATTKSFEDFLELVKPDVVYIDTVPREPWFSVELERREKDFLMTFTNLSTNESSSVEQCLKVEDLDLPTQFYMNRGNS